jgi:4-oxalomesaconate tautomerase
MRGGTSKGPFFRRADLPASIALRNRVLLSALGSPDPRQIDGLGGAHPLTSKAGIVDRSTRPGVDLEFLFLQLQPASDLVDSTPNCGNMLAAVVPFAIEAGLVEPRGDLSTYRVLTLNTDMLCDITVETPILHAGSSRGVRYDGPARIDGVPGTSAPIRITFLDTAGSVAPGLLPTGAARDHIELPEFALSLAVTCIDNGMPLVLIRAQDLGRTGAESVATLNADTELKLRLEALRLALGDRMGLGDVRSKNHPKMTLISAPQAGGTLATRSFIPHVCHDAIGVLAAVTVATACKIPGSICEGLAIKNAWAPERVSIEHPSGEFTVDLDLDPTQDNPVVGAALLRTARLIMRGEVMVPEHLLNTGD